MVKISNYGLLFPGSYFLAILAIESISATMSNMTNNEKNPFKTQTHQTDTFLVGANLGVQSEQFSHPADPNYFEQDRIHHEIENNQIYLDVPHANKTNDLKTVREEHNGFLQYNPDPLPTANFWQAIHNVFPSKYEANIERHYTSDSPQHVITSPNGYSHEVPVIKHFDSHNINAQLGLGSFQSSKPSGDIVYGVNIPTTTAPIRDTTPVSYQRSAYPSSQPFIPIHTNPLLHLRPQTTAFPLGQNYGQQINNARIDQRTFEGNELPDTHRPSVNELQNIISKIVKGSTKIHQVVKVPAIYEIHLQQEEIPVKQTMDNHHYHIPLPHRAQLPEYSSLSKPVYQYKQPPNWDKKTPSYQKSTTTWNLPPKIKYFNKKPSNIDSYFTKYVQPKPFTFNFNSIHSNLKSPSYADQGGSLNNPINEVSLLQHIPKPDDSLLNIGTPDLRLYYAKKKELDNSGLHGVKDSGNRRNERIGGADSVKSGRKGNQRFFLPPITRGLNYVIHVREKSSS